MVRADAEVELPLDPARIGAAGNLPSVVALEGVDRLLAELQLVVRLAEAGAAPGRSEEPHQPLQARAARLVFRLLAVVTLQHLVDDDSEPQVDRRFLRNPEDARELVLERAGPVEVDIGRRKRQALAPARQEGLQRGLVALRDQLTAALRRTLLVKEVRVEP